jgi:hypothetical protein
MGHQQTMAMFVITRLGKFSPCLPGVAMATNQSVTRELLEAGISV